MSDYKFWLLMATVLVAPIPENWYANGVAGLACFVIAVIFYFMGKSPK